MTKNDTEQRKREAAATELLRKPTFLYQLCQGIGIAGVTGEDRNRLVVYLACLTCFLCKVVSVLIKGATSTGKNNLAKAVLRLIPRDRILERSSLSEKALTYGSDELVGKILYIVEHRAGRDAQMYTRLLQSEGALSHEVTAPGGAGTRVASRHGAPMFLTTTTDETVYADDETRYLSLRADESSELTREIIRGQFIGPAIRENDESLDISVWHEAYRLLTTDTPRFQYPGWFAYLADSIPVDSSRARRDVPRLLSFLQAIALCRSFSDGRRKNSKVLEINFADYCVAHELLHEAFASTYAGAHPMALKFADAVRDLHEATNSPVQTTTVKEHLQWNSDAVAHKWRVVAVKNKLVRYQDGTFPSNKKPMLPGTAKKPTMFLPDPQLVFDKRVDVGNEITFIDPITGQERVFRRAAPKSQKSPK